MANIFFMGHSLGFKVINIYMLAKKKPCKDSLLIFHFYVQSLEKAQKTGDLKEKVN